MKKLESGFEKEELKTVRHDYHLLILNSQFLIYLAVLLLCSNSVAETLRFKFALGDKYSLVSAIDKKTLRVIDGNELPSEQTSQVECVLEVEDIDETGNAWTKYTYERVILKSQSKDLKLDFDSDAPGPKTPIQVMPFQLALGESVYLLITPQGHIEKINGLKALVTSAKARIGDISGADIVSQGLDREFSEQVVRRSLEDQFRVFPDSNNEGTTWARKKPLSAADMGYATMTQISEVNTVFERTFRLNAEKSEQNGVSVVDVNLIIRPETASVTDTQASDQPIIVPTIATREISGSGAGRIEIENATGRIINSKMTQDMVERVKMTTQNQMLRPPSGPQPATTHMVTTFQMTKIDTAKPARPTDTNEKGL